MAVKPTYEELEKRVQELERKEFGRKKAEEALQESEEKGRFLFENSNDGIFVVQKEMIKCPNLKAEKLSGYSKEELIKMRFSDFIHPEDRDMVLDRQKRRLAGEEVSFNYPFRIIQKNGEELWVELNSVAINWEKSPALLCFLQDKTQQRELEIRLHQAQKVEAIGRLAGGIAHDFNNILMSLLINAEMALEELQQDENLHFYLEEVLKAGNRAKDLVKQILTFSRQSREKGLRLKISPIVKEGIKFLRSSLPSTIEIREKIKVPEDLDSVNANPSDIHQVFMNLCTNAYHAMRDRGGELEINLTDIDIHSGEDFPLCDLNPGKYLRLTVSDTGHGMSREVMERIFDPYFPTKVKGTEAASGLSAVHEIMKDLNGGITVDSEMGRGTTFQVFFPCFEKEAPAETEEPIEIRGGDESVLFVDDDEDVIEIVGKVLERFGYKVEARTNSIEALQAFRNNPDSFDVVLTDQTMPHMTGADLAKEVMSIRPGIPVILCTGFSEQIDENAAKEMGIKAYVMKPIVMSQLAETIRKVLDET